MSRAASIVTGGTGALGRALVRVLLDAGRARRRALPRRGRVAGPAGGGRRRRRPSSARRPTSPTRPAPGPSWTRPPLASASLDGLALVAGAGPAGRRFDEAPDDEWTRMLRTNLDTVAHVCRAALPHLRKQGGSVVAVGSRAAETGGAGMAAYAVSKVAVHALVRVLALENAGARRPLQRGPARHDRHARQPARDARRGPLEVDVARGDRRVMAFLLSPESAPTTGALVPVDAPGLSRRSGYWTRPGQLLQRPEEGGHRGERRGASEDERAAAATASAGGGLRGLRAAAARRRRAPAPGSARTRRGGGPAPPGARPGAASCSCGELARRSGSPPGGRSARPRLIGANVTSAAPLGGGAADVVRWAPWRSTPPRPASGSTSRPRSAWPAATAFFAEPPPELAGAALGALVKARNLRPQAARSLAPDAQARILATVLDPGRAPRPGAARLAPPRRTGGRSSRAFLDALALPHEDGVLKEEADAAGPVPVEKAKAAVAALASFPAGPGADLPQHAVAAGPRALGGRSRPWQELADRA